MNLESLLPFFILLGVFLSILIIEAIVMYFFKVKPFWVCLGVSLVINIISFVFIYYVAGALLTTLGYPIGQFNGLQLPIQGILFICWVSSVADGLLISFWFKKVERRKIFLAAIVMNILSLGFLHFFIDVVSHLD